MPTIRMTTSEARKHGLFPVRKKRRSESSGSIGLFGEAAASCRLDGETQVVGLYKMTILNWHPIRCNQWYGKGWRIRHRMVKNQADILAGERHIQSIPKATCKRRLSLEVHGWPGKRIVPDLDAFDKTFLDACQRAGLILNDGPTGLEGRMEVKIVRNKEKKTVIILEDVPWPTSMTKKSARTPSWLERHGY